MKTPKEYTKNLKNHIITEDMIVDCLYSVNKRAKNFRDKAQEYKHSYYHGISQQNDMKRYYGYKEQLLSFFEPTCIHKQFAGYLRRRVYDYEKDYNKQSNRNIVWENCYYDRDEDREVWFYDYETKTKKYLYFLYYVIGEQGFHSPIENPSKYAYPIEAIDDDFTTEGRDITELVSTQFVMKVLETLATQECELHINSGIVNHKPANNELVIEKSRATREPTISQLEYIEALCSFYKCDKLQPKTFSQASKWLNEFLKTHNFASDKRKAETKERYLSILNDYNNGLSIEQLIEKYNLSKATIKKAIKLAQTYE